MKSDNESTYMFTFEFQNMMYNFGDCSKPSVESANLIEKVVQQCLIKMVYKLEEICKFRESKEISIEEFLYLFRKDRTNLIRVIHFLKNKDFRDEIKKQCGAEDEDEDEELYEKRISKKRLKICHNFFTLIDTSGSLLALLENDVEDELIRQRRIRLEKLTRQLTADEYMEFSRARCKSFASGRNKQKFKDWLISQLTDLDVKVNQYAFEILSYLAFEAVGEIVESSLLVRKDGEVRCEDPLTLYSSPSSGNHNNFVSKPQPPSNVANNTIFDDIASLDERSKKEDNKDVLKSKMSVQEPSLIERTAISTSEIREALRRLSQFATPFSNTTKSMTTFLSQRSWFYS